MDSEQRAEKIEMAYFQAAETSGLQYPTGYMGLWEHFDGDPGYFDNLPEAIAAGHDAIAGRRGCLAALARLSGTLAIHPDDPSGGEARELRHDLREAASDEVYHSLLVWARGRIAIEDAKASRLASAPF